jgi:pilus assembly protein Flp/PilA
MGSLRGKGGKIKGMQQLVVKVRYYWGEFRTHALTVRTSRPEHGQGLAEYALILALIAIIAIVALIYLGGRISGILHAVGSSV